MTTLGLAVIEWLMLVCSIKARIFQQEPTAENLTMWCNATEVLETRMERK